MASTPERSFKIETTKAILKQFFRGDRTKVTEEAAQLVAEVASLAVVEATLRAGKQAKTEGSTVIQAEHVEKVLPQLVKWLSQKKCGQVFHSVTLAKIDQKGKSGMERLDETLRVTDL